MKKRIILIALVALLAQTGRAGSQLTLSLAYPFSDPDTIDVYGRSTILPGLMLDTSFWKGLRFYGHITYYAKTITISDGEESWTSQLTKAFFAIGVEWRQRVNPISIFLRSGPVICFYRERAMGLTASGTALGWEVVPGLSREIGHLLVLELHAGYVWVKKHNTELQTDITLGGFKIGLGFGVRF